MTLRSTVAKKKRSIEAARTDEHALRPADRAAIMEIALHDKAVYEAAAVEVAATSVGSVSIRSGHYRLHGLPGHYEVSLLVKNFLGSFLYVLAYDRKGNYLANKTEAATSESPPENAFELSERGAEHLGNRILRSIRQRLFEGC